MKAFTSVRQLFFAVTFVLSAMLLSLSSGFAQNESDRAEILALNRAFYKAFRESDMQRMASIWGQREPIAVQHPATRRIDGRANVLASWAQILAAPPAIACEVESSAREAGKWAVICIEHLNPGTVRMINIFHKESGDWKMIYHGPAPKPAVVS